MTKSNIMTNLTNCKKKKTEMIKNYYTIKSSSTKKE